MTFCNFIKQENIIEIGILQNYTEVRVDTLTKIAGQDDFYFDFFAISFTIRNMPTPFWVKDNYPLIKMAIYNGTGLGLGTMMSYTNFTVQMTPGEIFDLGVVFKNEIVPSIDPVKPIKVVDTYFRPSQQVFNDSYFIVEYPEQILLPKEQFNFT